MVALCACSGSPIQLESIARIAVPATPNAAANGPTPTVAPETVSTAALVKERARLRVGIRFDAPPLSSVNADGKLEGLDVDLAREFARRWLGSQDNVDFVQVTSSSAPRRVEHREVDLALGGLVHDKSAETHADFSLTYLYDGESLLVRTGTFTDFVSLARRNITYIDVSSLSELQTAQANANITATLQTAPTYTAAVQQLRDGQTDAVLGRWRRLRTEAASDPTLSVLTVFRSDPVAMMLPQNDSDWANLVNFTLSALISDGTYAAMFQKWFGTSPDLVYPLPDAVDLQLAALPDSIAPRNTLAQLRAANTVRIGFNAHADPLATLDANGQPVGFEIDLCRELARRWFQTADGAQFTALSPGDIPADLRNNTIDIAVGAINETQANARAVDFSVPTFESGVAVVVLRTSTATDLASLTGKVLGVVQGGSDQALVEDLKRARNIDVTSVAYPDVDTALGAMRNGQVDGVANDETALLALVRTAKDVRLLDERLNRIPIAIALPTNDSALRDFVNLTLQDMFADGTYARLYKGWFGTAPETAELWPGEASLSTALIAATATTLPTVTPVFHVIDTATPQPIPPTAPPATPTPKQ